MLILYLILVLFLCVLSDFVVKNFLPQRKKEEAQRSAEGICHVLLMLILYLILVLFLCVLCDFAVSIFFTAEKKEGGAEIRRVLYFCYLAYDLANYLTRQPSARL
jgi:uncharacterized membrane protein